MGNAYAWGSPLLVPERRVAPATPRTSLGGRSANVKAEQTEVRPAVKAEDAAARLPDARLVGDSASTSSEDDDNEDDMQVQIKTPKNLMRLQLNDQSQRYGRDGRLQVKQCADGIGVRNPEYSL